MSLIPSPTVQSPAAFWRNLLGANVIDKLTPDLLLTKLTQAIIAEQVQPRTTAEIAADITPTNYLYPEGDLRRYGGIGDGVTDDTAALRAACDVGIVIVPAGFDFRIESTVNRDGKLLFRGDGGRLLGDSWIIHVTNGTGSLVTGFHAAPITLPDIIVRDPTNWLDSATVLASLHTAANLDDPGYQPTVSDVDISGDARIAALIASQYISPGLWFSGNASNITVRNVRGHFVSVSIYDGQDCLVEDVDVRGGRNSLGTVVFWNINGQEGRHNWARNIRTRYTSESAVVFARNYDGGADGVSSYRNGESGVKFWKGSIDPGGGPVDARCYNMNVSNTMDTENFFDGPDLSGAYPGKDEHVGGHNITNVTSYGCGGTGINIDGQRHIIRGVKIRNCGRYGFWGTGLANSVVSDLQLLGNNTSRGNWHDLIIDGDGNTVANVLVFAENDGGQYSVYAPAASTWTNVLAGGRPMFFGNIGAITATLLGVRDTFGGANPRHTAEVAQNYVTDNEMGLHLWPKRHQALIPALRATAAFAVATAGAEYSYTYSYSALNGALVTSRKTVAYAGLNAPANIFSGPNVAVNWGELPAGSFVAVIDQVAHKLVFQVKYSDGTQREGRVALT